MGQDLGRFLKPASQLIKYAHIDPITDFCILVIPDVIFQARAFKFDIVGLLEHLTGLSTLIPGFAIITNFYFFGNFFTHFLVPDRIFTFATSEATCKFCDLDVFIFHC